MQEQMPALRMGQRVFVRISDDTWLLLILLQEYEFIYQPECFLKKKLLLINYLVTQRCNSYGEAKQCIFSPLFANFQSNQTVTSILQRWLQWLFFFFAYHYKIMDLHCSRLEYTKYGVVFGAQLPCLWPVTWLVTDRAEV